MEILDDDILEQVVKTQNVKISFQEYKAEVIQESARLLGGGVLLLLGSGSFLWMTKDASHWLFQLFFGLITLLGSSSSFLVFIC